MPSDAIPDPTILQRNLAAISLRSPEAAQRINEASPSTSIEFSTAPDGTIIATLDGRAMCSKRDPHREATTWANKYPPEESGFLGILGFGLGYHIQALFETHQAFSVLLCYEPDVSLLRAVLERIDHSTWLVNALFLLETEPSNGPALTQLIKNAEAFIATGVEIAPHPPSKKRLEESSTVFTTTLLNVVKSTRTHLVTILSHSGYTLRNILMNTGIYATNPGITPLKDTCQGQTAILIAAGPSLQRNLKLLEEDPSIRDRAVIIAVQTMLKPLLERGIKPHFVTALDHHEISKRFYEGLSKEDVEGVRLVAEPKANAAITTTFPGEILFPSESQLDDLLGSKLSRDMGTIPAGATVAHLNYYLAKYLGCTNIILMGQDLGFTDGQYYSAGAAIHQVWAPELSEHRTLEMFEWERIARMKSLLRLKRDIHDRPIFTDEQMSTYIAQFETDFQDARDEGIRIINATEGGVHIEGTEVLSLKDALVKCLTDDPISLPETAHLHITNEDHQNTVTARIRSVLSQLSTIERNSRRTAELIEKAQSCIDDLPRVDKHIKSMHAIRDQVLALHPAFDLVNYYNQKGALNRFKVDRSIKIVREIDQTEKLERQLERDKNNIHWIRVSSEEVHSLLTRTLDVIEGNALPMMRDEFADDEPAENPQVEIHDGGCRHIEAVIFADPEIGPLGFPRNIAQPIHNEHSALALTIARLNRCTNLDGVTIITPDPDKIHELDLRSKLPLRIFGTDPTRFRARSASVAAARIASSDTWRGSIAHLGCYDESLDPIALVDAMEEFRIDAAVIVGPDWALLDPNTTDRIIARHRSDPDRCRALFTQAVPGIAGCLLDRSAADGLVQAAKGNSAMSSIGAMLSYIPVAPQGDPIASPLCLSIDPMVRDANVRAIADSTIRMQAISAVYKGLGEFANEADSVTLLNAYRDELNKRQVSPSRIVLELTSDNDQMQTEHAINLLKEARLLRDDVSVCFGGSCDPFTHPKVKEIIAETAQLGLAGIELRTRLNHADFDPDQLIQSGIQVLSVDVLANTSDVYERITGNQGINFTQLLDRMQELFDLRPDSSLPTPWIVPRMTRCDDAYEDIQGFYDRWLTVCGCAVIDANPNPDPNDRIQPLPVPHHRESTLAKHTLHIRSDGQIIGPNGSIVPNTNAIEQGVAASYKNLLVFLNDNNGHHIEPKFQTQVAHA